MLQKALRSSTINLNCVDSFGRGALTLAIDGENLEMVELLIIMGVETKDALLEAINQEFVEAVELLLEHEELIHKEGEPYVSLKHRRKESIFTYTKTFSLSLSPSLSFVDSLGKKLILVQLSILPK